MIRILVIADILLYRQSLAQILGRDGKVQVLRASATVAEALHDRGRAPAPDVVLLDMMSPDALAGVGALRAAFPGVSVVAVGVPRAEGDVIACAEAGVAGYVFRDSSLEELLATVESAARDELRCSPKLAATLLKRIASLAATRPDGPDQLEITARERQILGLIDDGLSNKEIAARLLIQVATVKNHIHNILQKLGVRRRGEAAAKMRGRRRPSDPGVLRP